MARRPHPDAVVSGSWLLHYARARTPDLPQALLAERLDTTPASLSRYESGARDISFAALQRAIGHTDYRMQLRLVREPHHDDIRDLMEGNDALQPFHIGSLSLTELMPAGLLSYEGTLPGEQPLGPVTGEALFWLYRVRELAARAFAPERRLQATYSEHKIERDRDLVHRIQDCGAGAGQAARCTGRSCAGAPPSRGSG
jgi:transcriptional regulator with XRE-family HTH domain